MFGKTGSNESVYSGNALSSDFILKILSDTNYIYEDKNGITEVNLDANGNMLSSRKRGTTNFLRYDNRETSDLPIEEEKWREETDKGFYISTKIQYRKNNTQYSEISNLRVSEFLQDKNGRLIAVINKSDDEFTGPQLDVVNAIYAYYKYK